MNENELTTVNDRVYVNPQVSIDESNDFINNFRNIQSTNNAEVESQTHALGSDLPTFQGGLSGAGNSFISQYQTPTVNKAISDLKATVQSDALSLVLKNKLAQKQKEYNDAYKEAYKRATATTNNNNSNKETGDVEDVVTSPSKFAIEGIASAKIQKLYQQYLANGESASDAMKHAIENWGNTYQSGSEYKTYSTGIGTVNKNAENTTSGINWNSYQNL